MPYASKAQQAMFNARAAQGDPQFIKLARDFNQATYGRPGFTKGGARTGATGTTRGGPAKYAKLPEHVSSTQRLAAKMARKRRSLPAIGRQ
jgi:hypothetical protein